MASAPSERGPIRGRVDGGGRLVAADPELAALQEEAGSRVGAELALPQLAAIARLTSRLGVPIYRSAIVAGADQDIELSVRATPEGPEVALSLDRWTVRPPAPARLGALVAHEQEVELGGSGEEWAADEDLRVVSISAGLAERLGLTVEDAVGQPLTRLFRLEENDGGELPLLAAATSRSEFSDQRARPRRGADEVLVLRGIPVTGADGRFAGFKGEVAVPGAPVASAGGGPSVSPLDQVIDEALRSPLDRIIDSADGIVAQSDGPLRPDYADYASDIAAAARHLLSVIRSMNGEAAGDHDRVDLVALSTEASSMLEAAAEPRGVIVAMEPSAPLWVRGDPRGVIQILVNLVGNAVRHSPDGGTVTLSFEPVEGMVRVNVVDQGPGIDPADQQRIFERFERAHTESGTGLGLAIARRLARSMGGDISLESTPGEGARFTLALPAA